jgi:hypothetical protein
MKSAQTHHFMACFQFKKVEVFKTLHFGSMHNLISQYKPYSDNL